MGHFFVYWKLNDSQWAFLTRNSYKNISSQCGMILWLTPYLHLAFYKGIFLSISLSRNMIVKRSWISSHNHWGNFQWLSGTTLFLNQDIVPSRVKVILFTLWVPKRMSLKITKEKSSTVNGVNNKSKLNKSKRLWHFTVTYLKYSRYKLMPLNFVCM